MAIKCERVLIIIFLIVYVLTVYDKGFSITSTSPASNRDHSLPISPPSNLPNLAKQTVNVVKDVSSVNFEKEGRRLECLSLIASQVDRLDKMTLVRMPRRKATAYLASQALNVPGDFVEAGV